MEKLTFDLLLKRKEQAQNDKLEAHLLECEFLNADIEVVKGKSRKVLQEIDRIENPQSIEQIYDFSIMNIYRHCPIFKDKQLQSEYECVEPIDIVEKVFDENITAITKFSDKILTLYGYGLDDMKDEQKRKLAIEEAEEEIKN